MANYLSHNFNDYQLLLMGVICFCVGAICGIVWRGRRQV